MEGFANLPDPPEVSLAVILKQSARTASISLIFIVAIFILFILRLFVLITYYFHFYFGTFFFFCQAR